MPIWSTSWRPQPPARRALPSDPRRVRHRRALRCAEAGRAAARRHFPACLGGLRRGRSRFRQGLRHQSRRNPRLVRGDPARTGARRRRLSATPHLHLLDRRLRRAVPGKDRRRIPRRAPDQLRNPEGDLRAFARRLFAARLLRRHWPAPADDLRAAGGPTRRPRGSSPALSASRSRARRRSCRSATMSATGTPRPAPRSSSCCARRSSISRLLGSRRSLNLPGVSVTVGEQIEALRAIAGDEDGRASSGANPTRRSPASSPAGREISIRRARRASVLAPTPTFLL